MSIFSRIIRKCSIAASRSKIRTSLVPLAEMRSVTVLLDGIEPGAPDTEFAINNFFSLYGYHVNIMKLTGSELNIFGRIKKKYRFYDGVAAGRHEDLFISLLTGSTYAEEYEAHCSPARFKIGRSQFKTGVYDFLVSDPKNKPYSQKEVFVAIADFLNKIKG